MGNNYGVQPIKYGNFVSGLFATLASMLGGSSNSVDQSEIDKEVAELEKSQNNKRIEELRKMVTSYKTGKVKPSKKIVQEYKDGKLKTKKIVQEYKDGKLKTEKGPNMKKAKMEIKEASKGQRASKGQKENGEREER